MQEADDSPRGDPDAEQPEEPGDLGGRQTALLAEHHRMRHGPGPEVAAGGTRGRGRLVGVASLYCRPAARAAAPLDRKAAVEHRHAGQLLLVDVLGVLVGHLGPATGTVFWKGHHHGLVDVVGDRPVGLGAVGPSRPAPRATGLGGEVVLGERGGLAAGGPLEHLHRLAQPGHLGA